MTRAQLEVVGIILCLFLLVTMITYIRAEIEPPEYPGPITFKEWRGENG